MYNVKVFAIFATTLVIILSIATIVFVSIDRFCRSRQRSYNDFKFLLDVDIVKLSLDNGRVMNANDNFGSVRQGPNQIMPMPMPNNFRLQ